MPPRRRRKQRRKVVVTALLLVLALGAGLAALTSTGSSRVTGVVELSADRFRPSRIAVGAGQRLEVRNLDAYAHTFTVDALDLDLYVGPTSTRPVDVPEAPQGVYELYCRVPGHEAMTATLEVH